MGAGASVFPMSYGRGDVVRRRGDVLRRWGDVMSRRGDVMRGRGDVVRRRGDVVGGLRLCEDVGPPAEGAARALLGNESCRAGGGR